MRSPVGKDWQDYEDNWYLADTFGTDRGNYLHSGVDLNIKSGGNTDLGEKLYAILDWTKRYYHANSHPNTGFGVHCVYQVTTPDEIGWWVHYAHCENKTLFGGKDSGREGDVIATIGNTGNSSAAHVHLSIFKVDPNTLPSSIDTVPKTDQQLIDWFIDPVVFFNKYKDGDMSNTYKGIDLDNTESVKVAVDTWAEVRDGEFVRKDDCADPAELAKINERLRKERESHKQELQHQKETLHQQCEVQLNEAKDRWVKTKLKPCEDQVSTLEQRLLDNTPEWKKRFTSRKFILALLALILPILNRFLQLEMSAAEILAVLTPVMAFIGAEGWTDYKERMMIHER